MPDNKQVFFDKKVGAFHVIVMEQASGGVKVQAFSGDKEKLISELRLVASNQDLSVAEEVSAQLLKPVELETILEVVASHYKIPASAIRGKRRQPRIAEARHVAMWLAKQLTAFTLKELAKAFGKNDHTTVVHGAKRVVTQMEADADFAYRVEFMRKKIKKESDG